MKTFKFFVIFFLFIIILFSIFRYVSNKPIFEGLNGGKFSIVNTILNDTTSTNVEKITSIRHIGISDTNVTAILNNNDKTNEQKVQQLKEMVANVNINMASSSS